MFYLLTDQISSSNYFYFLRRDYSKKLFWAAIPYAWERVTIAARVQGKSWSIWQGPDAQPW